MAFNTKQLNIRVVRLNVGFLNIKNPALYVILSGNIYWKIITE